MMDRKLFIRRASFAAYFAAAFLIFLFILFPFERVKSRLVSEVGSRTPFELSVAHISPRFFNRFVLKDVVLSDKAGKVLFESKYVHTTISLFGLLRKLLSVQLNAPAYGGEIYLKVRQGTAQQSFALDASGLDIGAYSLLKDLGLQVTGKLGGNFEMNGDAGKGTVWFKGLAWRGLKVKGFSVPDLDFDQGWLEGELKGERLTVKKLEIEGKDLKIQASGDMMLRERGLLNLAVKLKPSERLAREQSGILALLKNKDTEGFYQFTIGGTVSDPLPRL